MHLRLAWRNIWRNPKRTLIIITAVFVGIWSLVFLSGYSVGLVDSMKQNGIKTLTGHIQVHQQGFRQDPVIENSIAEPSAVLEVMDQILPRGSQVSSRIRLSAVVSNARHSTGVTMVGIDPRDELQVSFLGDAPIQGRMLAQDDSNMILVGRALLEDFETEIGHKLVLMAQAEDKEIESRAFHIVGVYDAEMEATEKQYVFVLGSAAQDMLGMGGSVSEICVMLPDGDQAVPTAAALRLALGDQGLDVADWQELLPLVTLYLSVFDSFMYLWWLVVFIAMAFGIVNTMLMAVLERIREFGLLKSLGMRPGSILAMVLTEAFFLLGLGLILGNILGAATTWLVGRTGLDFSAMAQGSEYMGISRVVYPVVDVKSMILGSAMVLVLGLLVCLYPALKAARITPVKALAHT